jgi:hypothetical protein
MGRHREQAPDRAGEQLAVDHAAEVPVTGDWFGCPGQPARVRGTESLAVSGARSGAAMRRGVAMPSAMAGTATVGRRSGGRAGRGVVQETTPDGWETQGRQSSDAAARSPRGHRQCS